MLRLLDILPFAGPSTPSDSSVPWEGSELRRKYLEPLQRCSTSENGSTDRRRYREQAQKPSFHHSIPGTRRAVRSPWCRTRDPSCALQWVSVPPRNHENRPNWLVGRLHYSLRLPPKCPFQGEASARPLVTFAS